MQEIGEEYPADISGSLGAESVRCSTPHGAMAPLLATMKRMRECETAGAEDNEDRGRRIPRTSPMHTSHWRTQSTKVAPLIIYRQHKSSKDTSEDIAPHARIAIGATGRTSNTTPKGNYGP